MGEKVVRDSRSFHGLDDVQIDLFSGWELHHHHKNMQIHYAGQQRNIRVKRGLLTAMI